MPHQWLILTALTREARAIAQEFGLRIEPDLRPTILPVAGSAVLHIIGIGGKRMSADLCQGITGGIILAGLAGAVEKNLKIGDIVVDYPNDGPWQALPWQQGTIHTSEQILSDPAQKAVIFRQTGALAVDMETTIVRRFANEANLPLLTIRAISDTAQDVVSPKLLDWIDDTGNPKAAALAGGLAMNPLLLPQVIQLGNRSRQAARNLGQAVYQLLGEPTSPLVG